MNCPHCHHEVPAREQQRMATVRMPASLYTRLQELAREVGESLNSLCVTALRRELAPRLELDDGAIVIHQPDGTAIRCETLAEAEQVLDDQDN